MDMGGSRMCVYNEIVAEPLTNVNQKEWFEWVRNYLIAQDLWKVTNGKSGRPARNGVRDSVRWRRKNAAALHVIQISCGPQSFSHIRGVSEAKDAWHILNQIYNPPLPDPPLKVMGEQVDFDAVFLLKAIRDNNLCAAKAFLDEHPSALTAKLDIVGRTPLHLAAMFGHICIVKELVRLLPPQSLEVLDVGGYTPLITATYTGLTQIAECMVNKNSNIVGIPTSLPWRELPVTVAFSRGHNDMGRYLYSVTPLDCLKPDNGLLGVGLLNWCIVAGALDVVLDLLQRCEELLFATDKRGRGPIMGIAALPLTFPNASQFVFWKRWIYRYINIQSTTMTSFVRVDIQRQDEINRVTGLGPLPGLLSYIYNLLGIKEIHELKLVHAKAAQILTLICKNVTQVDNNKEKEDTISDALYLAARRGNVEFVSKVARACPKLILNNSRGEWWNTFFYAVRRRQAEIFNLIHGLRFKDALATHIDFSGNNMLHVAGQLAPYFRLNHISGPALQMQSELQWFKEVESVVPYGFKTLQNHDGMLPENVFKESHKELRKEGETWMKETASSCSVAGALVVTIMFAAAFTVPGGNNQESGYPIFLKEKLFVLFIISDALSLFSSSTSVLMFLGILTSRYANEDFLKSLPTKLIIGLSALFLSIATMVIAFSACILIMFHHRYSWSLIPVIMVASVPVTLFALLQFPLLVQMVSSTYGPGIFNRHVKLWP